MQSMLRIRIQGQKDPRSGSASQNLSILTQKIVSKLSDRIRILTFYPYRIPAPGVKKAPHPGSEFATMHKVRGPSGKNKFSLCLFTCWLTVVVVWFIVVEKIFLQDCEVNRLPGGRIHRVRDTES